MKKIPSLFIRNFNNEPPLYTSSITPGTEWAVAGEGVATQKHDGTACLIKDGKLYKRYDCKRGKKPPPNFEPCEESPDPVTGHWPGWVPVGNEPESRWHREAWGEYLAIQDGTYELVGPRVQANPERRLIHYLIQHGSILLPDCPRTFNELREWLKTQNIEGVVWHHPDGRMVKAVKQGFGLVRTPIADPAMKSQG